MRATLSDGGGVQPPRLWPALALVMAFAACGAEPAPSADAGPPDAALGPATPPNPPASPTLVPCPAGWTEHEVRPGVSACDPGEETAVCGPGEAWLPGATSCAPIGRACPADGWPADLSAGANVRFVRAGATGGDGATRATPFGTIGAALAGAPPGTILAIAVGRYPESVLMRAGIELRGACASGTRIGGPTGTALRAAIDVRVRDAALVDIGVVPADSLGILVDLGSLRVDGVSVEGATAFGITALEAEITGRRVLVRDVAPLPDGTYGFGLTASLVSHVTLEDVVVERASGAGLQLAGPAQVGLAGLAVRDTRANEGGRNGRGIEVMDGAQVDISRAELSGSQQVGLFVLDAGTRVVVSDTLIRDTASRAFDGSGGAGIAVFGATVELARVHVLRSRAQGVLAGMDATVVGRDVIVEDTRDSDNGAGLGIAIAATPGAMVTIERALLVGSWSSGIVAGGGVGTFEDVSIVDALGSDASGVGIGLGLGGVYTVRRALIDGASSEGLIVTGAPAEVTFEDVLVRDTRPRADGTFGRGLEANGGVTVHIARARFERMREIAVLAFGDGTRVDAVDLAIVDTAARACAGSTCVGLGGGSGLGAYQNAELRVERFVVRSAALCGAQIASGGALELRNGEIRGATVGACVQVPGYDLTRLTNGVLFDENGVNVDTASAYVPEPVTGLPLF